MEVFSGLFDCPFMAWPGVISSILGMRELREHFETFYKNMVLFVKFLKVYKAIIYKEEISIRPKGDDNECIFIVFTG